MSKIKENNFISGDFVVYPSHGVGKIIGTETREIEQTKLFEKQNNFKSALQISETLAKKNENNFFLQNLNGYILILDLLNLNFRKAKINKRKKCLCNL